VNWKFWQRECAQCKRYEQGLARLKSMNFRTPEGEDEQMIIDAAFDGAAVKLFAAAAAHWFKETGGENFVTLDMSDPKSGDHYQLTMQKAGGKTPAQKIMELEALLAGRTGTAHET